MDGVAPHLPHTHPAGEVLYIHSASDAAIAFSRGATPCAKSIPTQAGMKRVPSLLHPATRPPQDPLERCHGRTHPNDSASEGRARLPMHTCARTRAARSATEDSHPDRSGAQSSENPQVSFRTPVADRGLARWQSIIPRTQKPTKTQARWQSHRLNAVARSPVAHRTAAGL